SENLHVDSRKLRPPTKKLQGARVRLSSDSRPLPDDFTHALSSNADRLARQRRQPRRRIQSFRPAHLCPDHLLFYWDSSAGAPAKEQQKLISALKTGDRVVTSS